MWRGQMGLAKHPAAAVHQQRHNISLLPTSTTSLAAAAVLTVFPFVYPVLRHFTTSTIWWGGWCGGDGPEDGASAVCTGSFIALLSNTSVIYVWCVRVQQECGVCMVDLGRALACTLLS